MIKRLFVLLLSMMTLGAAAQMGKFTIKGTYEQFGDSVQFFFPNPSQGDIPYLGFKQNEIRAVTGKMLEVSFNLREADKISIRPWFTGRHRDEDGDITLPAIPGDTLVLMQDENGNLILGGSQFYVDYNEAWQKVNPINQAAKAYVKEVRGKIAAGVPKEQLMGEYKKKMPLLIQELVDTVTNYVKAHPDQDAAAALIAELPEDLDYLEPAVALLTERAYYSVAANLFKDKFEKLMRAKQFALEGSMAPDFTLMDINGKPLTLSSLRGKWVILDFWGSWCIWCIKGMPKMKEYYEKYQGKFEILGVDCNDTVEKWKEAVAKNELPWLHVYWDTEDENCDNPVDLYNVQGFPTKVVIDPEGRVAKIVVGENPAFYDFLDEVLK